MRRVVPLIYVCLLLMTTAAPAFAQQRLFIKAGGEVVELDTRLPTLGAVVRRFPVPASDGRAANLDVTVLGGGRFLAWVDWPCVLLLDTFSGATLRFTHPDFYPGRVIGSDGNARLVVLGGGPGPESETVLVVDARSGHTRLLDLGPPWRVGPIAYAAAGHVLFVARPRSRGPIDGTDFRDVDVMDLATGALLRTIDISPAFSDDWSVAPLNALSANAAGTRLFVTDLHLGTVAFDVISGRLAASNTSITRAWLSFHDEYFNRLLVTTEEGEGIEAFAADSLQFLGRVSVSQLPLPPGYLISGGRKTRELDVSGLSATMFVLQGAVAFNYACHSELIALEVDAGRIRRRVDTTDALGIFGCGGDLVRVTEPAPPHAGTADVAGRQVTLRWQAPLGASEYEIEAGSAPGLANLATVRVTNPQLVVDGVPTGTYYVRVRGINTIGKSAASREFQIIVP